MAAGQATEPPPSVAGVFNWLTVFIVVARRNRTGHRLVTRYSRLRFDRGLASWAPGLMRKFFPDPNAATEN